MTGEFVVVVETVGEGEFISPGADTALPTEQSRWGGAPTKWLDFVGCCTGADFSV